MDATNASQTVCSYRFVQTLVVEYEILVLLPGGHEIVRNSVEDLAIDFGLMRMSATANNSVQQHLPTL